MIVTNRLGRGSSKPNPEKISIQNGFHSGPFLKIRKKAAFYCFF